MLDRRRFRRLFLRRFVLLTLVAAGLAAVFATANAFPHKPMIEWIGIIVLDLAALLGASALSAWLNVLAEERRRH